MELLQILLLIAEQHENNEEEFRTSLNSLARLMINLEN